ncbi:MAG TPA: hypothetical protein VMC02_12615 [Steroidobacteraceae bacterium]|nr:hypothetical protein [Steroidobacteraceae bacterium]
MKRSQSFFTIVILAGVVLAGAVLAGALDAGAAAPDRPPGISAAEWAPINATMGVVLVDRLPGAIDAPIVQPSPASGAATRNLGAGALIGAGGGAALIPPVTGYLMVRQGGIWKRLVVIDPIKGPGVAG